MKGEVESEIYVAEIMKIVTDVRTFILPLTRLIFLNKISKLDRSTIKFLITRRMSRISS